MKKLWAAGGALVSAILWVVPAGAVSQGPSGDTCTSTGNGTAYSVSINLPPNATEQAAFAFGAPGATITGIKIPGNPGTFSTQNLPANTTASWVLTSPPATPPGSQVSGTVTTNHSITGAFTVVPATAATSGTPLTYYDPISCPIVKTPPAPSNKFTVQAHFTYSTGTWHFFVTVPGRGRISIGSKNSPKLLFKSRTIPVGGAGKAKVTLVPTAAGKAMLTATGSIKTRLIVEFSPTNGKPANKTIAVTLRK
jgi:hypothetical protein